MPEQSERHAPAGLVLAVDAGRLLIDAHDGADARLQMAILEAVKGTPQVLDSPEPSVFFIGFGASSLEFEVRAFILKLAHRATVINDLNISIERALRMQEIAMS